jgi:lysyl endopeptidase
LWTPVIEGDEIVVEVFVPSGASQPAIEIGKVNQGYRGIQKSGDKDSLGFGTEGTCEIDVVCPQGNPWPDQIRATGVYTVNGTEACTGTLLNDTAVDFRPYFLSAHHCNVDSTSDATVVVYWNFQSATCGTHGPGSLSENQTGSTFRAASLGDPMVDDHSDFLLLELSATPDPSFNVFHAGWDATGTTPSGTVGIHHPHADVKAISLSNSAPETTAYYSDTPDPSGDHWRAVWDSGVTEAGSSGSCLFETSNGRCIGQLHGGPSICGAANSDLHDFYGRFSVSWNGGGTPATRLKDWLDPGNTGILSMHGDPHITTADGIHYDFQGAGEFVALREGGGLEIQTRQTAVATTFTPITDPHDGLATCVSINTAVAARVGKRRVTIQPNITGVPDPSGLQVRVDGNLTAVSATGLDLGSGGRIAKSSTGFELDFPNGTVLTVTPIFWTSQSKWHLNVDVFRAPATNGIKAAALGRFHVPTAEGIMGVIAPGSWLPALPDGTSLGPLPVAAHQRYTDLYQKFGDAWRVTDKTSLFDYAPGTSTATFTLASWPPESPPCVVPNNPPAKPLDRETAQRLCRGITNKNMNANCAFDVTLTGEPSFARLYELSQAIRVGATATTVNFTQAQEVVTLTATVTPRPWASSDKGMPTGTVQFAFDGRKAGNPVKLDSNGRATWKGSRGQVGNHQVTASYIPAAGSPYLPSSSVERVYLANR